MDKLVSVKTIGMPHGIANIMKPAKVSSIDLETIPIAAETVKNVAKFSLIDGKEAGTSGNHDLVHLDLNRCPMNRVDVCR